VESLFGVCDTKRNIFLVSSRRRGNEKKPLDLALESKPLDLALESKPLDFALESKPLDLE